MSGAWRWRGRRSHCWLCIGLILRHRVADSSRVRLPLQSQQVGSHLRCSLITQVAVLFQGLVDQLFQLLGNLGIQPHRGYWGTVQNPVEDHSRGVAMEG